MGKGLTLLLASVLTFAVGAVAAAPPDVRTYVPAGAHTYAPDLVKAQQGVWAAAPAPWTLAGQVEQESCVSLTSPRCWNPHAELKTSREYGFGFGQITKAFRKDGSVRFDTFQELTSKYPALKDWTWDDRYNARYQLTALVELDQNLFNQIRDAATTDDRLAFMLAGYNGGASGVLQDRLLCSNTPKCDQSRWFGHVENTSLKTRLVNPGYSKSAFQINREYVYNIVFLRRPKYQFYWSP